MKTKKDARINLVQQESELIPILARGSSSIGGLKRSAAELSSGYGIADLVFYELDKRAVRKRASLGQNPIEEANLIRVLVELNQFRSNDKISLTYLREKVPSIKKYMITYLIENKFLSVEGSGRNSVYRKGVGYSVGSKDIIAIEAKLKDWKKGLYQAYRYKSYADKSYLAVYTKAINPPLKNLAEFKKYNIGLIEVSESGVTVHYHPKTEDCKDRFISAMVYENLLTLEEDAFPDINKATGLVAV